MQTSVVRRALSLGPEVPLAQIGPFVYFSNGDGAKNSGRFACLPAKKVLCLRGMVAFMGGKPARVAVSMLAELQNTKDDVSKRTLNWLVTNYSKTRSVRYLTTAGKTPVALYNLYMRWRRNFKRPLFDVFKRSDNHCAHLIFHVDAKTRTVLETTVSQVNFFMFAVDCGLIDYARRRQHDIEADHIDTVAAARRRRQASSSSTANPTGSGRRKLNPNMAHGCMAFHVSKMYTFEDLGAPLPVKAAATKMPDTPTSTRMELVS